MQILFNDLIGNGYDSVKIIGISSINASEEDADGMVSQNSLPWLQDNVDEDVWDQWNVEIRDFIIFDKNGNYFSKINLTVIDPSFNQNYNNIKTLLINALDV